MSSAAQVLPPRTNLNTQPFNQRRGMEAMWAVIATEFMLFACMFAAYYYLGSNKDRWANETPPVITYAIVLLVILLSSSFILFWGERQVKAGRLSGWPAGPLGDCALRYRLPHAAGFRIRRPLENAHALQRLLRVHLLCHHDASRSARDRWASSARVCRDLAALRNDCAHAS